MILAAAAAVSLAVSLMVLQWALPDLPHRILLRSGEKPGVSITRFENESWEGTPSKRSERKQMILKRPGEPLMEGNHFSLEISGFVYLPVSGHYDFVLQSDDGALVEIGGEPVISDPGYHPVRKVERRVFLDTGWKSVRVRYFNGTSDAGFRLQWRPPGRPLSVLNQDYLFQTRPDTRVFKLYRTLQFLYRPVIPLIFWVVAAFLGIMDRPVVRRFMKRSIKSLIPAAITGGILGCLLFLLFCAFYHLPKLNPVPHGMDVRVIESRDRIVDLDRLKGSVARFNSVTHPSFGNYVLRLIFSGWLYIDDPGEFGFSLQADDDAALFIDGQRVLFSSVTEQFRVPVRQRFYLSPGFHNLQIQYHNQNQPAYIDLKWARPDSSFYRPIQKRYLYTYLPTPEEKKADSVSILRHTMIRWTLIGLIIFLIAGIIHRFSRRDRRLNFRVGLSVFAALFLAATPYLHPDHLAGLRWFTERDSMSKLLMSLLILVIGSGSLNPLIRRLRIRVRNGRCTGWILGFAAVLAAAAGQICLTGIQSPIVRTGAGLYIVAALLIWSGGFRPASQPFRDTSRKLSRNQRIASGVLILIVLLVAILFRFYRLHEMPPGLWWDEAQTGRVVQDILRGAIPPVYDLRINAGTAASYLNAAWCFLVDTTGPWGLRSYAAFIGVLTVLASGWFFRQLFTSGWALFGMSLVAGSRWLVSINRTAMATIDETVLLTFLVLTLYIKAVRSGRTNHYAITGLLLGLAMHLHTGARVLPVIIGIDILVQLIRKPGRIRRRYGMNAALLVFCAIVVFAPMARHIYHHSEEYMKRSRETLLSTEYPGWYPAGPILENVRYYIRMYFNHGDWHPRHNYNRTPQLPAILSVCAALGAFLSAGRFFRRREHRLMILGFCLISLQGILTVHMNTANLNRVAENIPIVFAWAVYGAEFVSRGIVRLAGNRRGRIAAATFAAILTVISWWRAWDVYFNDYLPWPKLAQVYGFQPEITEMASLSKSLIQSDPEIQVWAMYILGDPFQYVFPGDTRLHDLSIPTAPVDKADYPMAFIIPAHREEMVDWVRRTFPGATETAIPYSLNDSVILLHLFRVSAR
ncbi:MAG TPA: PA14 domain-containing protein [bacterium]|nr:PA14 domain-containing protein [bacterium]